MTLNDLDEQKEQVSKDVPGYIWPEEQEMKMYRKVLIWVIAVPYATGAAFVTFALGLETFKMLRRILTCSSCRKGKVNQDEEYMQFDEYKVDYQAPDITFEDYYKELNENNKEEA